MNITTKENSVFSPSVNIVRDSEVVLNYIPTPNAIQSFLQIINNYQIGIRAFNLVGAYGIGKSAFLWAIENDLRKATNFFFDNDNIQGLKEFNFIRFIGEYSSLQESFANKLGIKGLYASKDIIDNLKSFYLKTEKENKGLVILVDEFGKFLEFASKNNPEKELYFIQELAEFVNDSKKNIILVSTLHQDFNRYSDGLSILQQNEWDKVKGRLKEITFNEPVEQLLYLAAKRVDQLNFKKNTVDFDSLFKLFSDKKLFPLKDYFSKEIAKELLPFDILSAAILTIALQKYGQNERSLFSFLESNDPYGFQDYNKDENPYYNLACVYDYLIHNYYSFLTSKFNPHFSQWATIRTSIEKIEGLFSENQMEAIKIVKTIGILNILTSAVGIIDLEFIKKYSEQALKVNNVESIVDELLKFKIVRFQNYLKRYVLTQGTDLDIEKALQEAALQIEKPSNVISYLEQHFNFNFVNAKSIYYRKGTPRFFEFQLVDAPTNSIAEGEVDGYIQLIFSNYINERDIINFSRESEEAIVFAHYKDTDLILNAIYEILKIEKVKSDNIDDKIAVNELDNIRQHQVKLLNKLVLEDLYSANKKVKWYIDGEEILITNPRILNQKLSIITDRIYSSTPVFRNEMVNRTKLSTPITTAKKNLIRSLVDNWTIDNLGYEGNNFPPDRTIYLSLLNETGMHSLTRENEYEIGRPNDESFNDLWDIGEEFLNSAKHSKRNLQDFADQLSTKPFKLKQGFIDFWIPIFLFAKRNDFALFSNDIYVVDLSDETLDLVGKNPGSFEIKTFDVEGIKLKLFNKYRVLLEQTEKDTITNQNFVETIKPFLKFYKETNFYAKNTKRLSSKAIDLRNAIAQSKDPEKTFFEEFPKTMGYNIVQLQNDSKILEQYFFEMQKAIKEIRLCYSALLERFEYYLLNDIIGEKLPFEDFKIKLQNRFNKIKKHLLKPNERVFIQRLFSPLDDKEAWLNSLVQVVVGKTLDFITDEEEAKLYSSFTELIRELDNLCEISSKDVDEEKEDIFKIEITSFVDGLKKNLVRLPKEKTKEAQKKEAELKLLLGNDSGVNIAILTSLLQQELKK
ncbi:MAG: hypothetical protein ABIQ27_10710 [Flavobacterium sp.]|uniref:hypothetical protein n=1 Tax=Flavobacterium sp. TaxID=239 RepID=UPI003265D54E